MLNTGMNYYGVGQTSFTGTNDILTSAYANPMTTCSASGYINVNGAQLPTNYDNDFLMPQELKIANCLNGSMQGNAPQVGDQFVSSQNAQTKDAQAAGDETQAQGTTSNLFQFTPLKKKGAVAGFLAPLAMGAYKVMKGAAASKVFNKELLVKCPIMAVAGVAVAALAEKFFGNSNAAAA